MKREHFQKLRIGYCVALALNIGCGIRAYYTSPDILLTGGVLALAMVWACIFGASGLAINQIANISDELKVTTSDDD